MVKKNVLSRFRFVKVANGQVHFTQRYIHTANGTCRENKAFFEAFLQDFMNIVLLDEDLAIQNCYYVNTPQVSKSTGKHQSSTTLSSIEHPSGMHGPIPVAQIKSHLVVEELIDLIQSICSPPEMKSILYA